MKIFATEFEHDGKTYDGPNIIAKDFDQAEALGILKGLTVLGEITDYVDYSLTDTTEHTFH